MLAGIEVAARTSCLQATSLERRLGRPSISRAISTAKLCAFCQRPNCRKPYGGVGNGSMVLRFQGSSLEPLQMPEVSEAHGLSRLLQGAVALGAGTTRPLHQDLLHQPWLRFEVGASLPDGGQEGVEGTGQPLLPLPVAHATAPVAALEVLDLFLIGVEGVVVD